MPNRDHSGETDSERLAVIEHAVLDMRQRLFGNGQPGELSSVKARISKLERWQWIAGGALLALNFALQIWKK